ncbi:unnamed protein product, partial [Meganyctiphanes norvegica]
QKTLNQCRSYNICFHHLLLLNIKQSLREGNSLLQECNRAHEWFRGMNRRQRIVMAVIIGGSLIYIILTQTLLVFSSPPGEPTEPEFRKTCSSVLQKISKNKVVEEDKSLPVIYVVTPTYRRPEMVAELTRLGQTLTMVPRVHWIVAEDSNTCTASVQNILERLGLPYTHIASPMPEVYRKERYVPRGVSNRRASLEWVREYGEDTGILYFLDDDNAIDIRLFEEMRTTKKVSMWPVGLIGEYTVSSPVVKDGKVVAFYDGWPAGRKFQVDMAGFAVNMGFLKSQAAKQEKVQAAKQDKKHPKVTMPYIAGHEEDGFLKSLNMGISDIEVKAEGCTQILVWHTQTIWNPSHALWLDKHQTDNIKKLTDNMRHLGMIK